ncbi:MAG: DUF3291 domain-containing protein [Chloroflexota bacterium]
MTYHLAQINAAPMLAPLDSPQLRDFVDGLVRINHLAEQSPGFVWRLVGDGGDATDIRLTDDADLLINMSVWENMDVLYAFTYNTEHVEFFRRRREWFAKWERPSPVMWWIPEGELPTLQDARERIDHMEQHGPTPFAFNFKKRFSVSEMLEYTAKQST